MVIKQIAASVFASVPLISFPVATLSAQEWPNRPITMMVPFVAGSATDTSGRVLAAALSEVLGQQVVVENVGGGGSMTGTARVAKAASDGYTFVFASVDSMAIVPATRVTPLYNSVTDFAAVGLVVEQPIVLVARRDLPVTSLPEFVTFAKANHGTMQFGSSGVGSGSHFSCSQLNSVLGVSPTHVPYRGSGLAMQDLIAGRIDYFCALGAAAMGPMEGGTVKAIAMLTSERSPLFGNLPTAKEQGVSGVEPNFWTGFFFPKGTPGAIVQKLQRATASILNNEITKDRLRKVGVTPVPPEQRSSEYLEQFLKSEVELWKSLVKAAGIPVE